MEMRQRFTAEFEREAVRLIRTTNKPAAMVAREPGIPRNRLYKWAQDAEMKGDQAFRGWGRPKASSDELSALKRELARLKEENGILKKRRRTSRGSCREVRLERRRTRPCCAHAVPGTAGLAEWLPRMAHAPPK